MKGALFTFLAVILFSFKLTGQCPIPDFSYCYSNDLTDEVIYQLCPQSGMTVSAEIFQGEFENGIDFLSVYEGTMGSGTSGTQIFNSSGNVQGTNLGPTAIDNCLIFVVNSDLTQACLDQPYKELHVFDNTLPTYDIDYCYDNNEIDVQIAELCPAPGFTLSVEICKGSYEQFFGDDLEVFEGASGSGTGGLSIFGPSQGDLSGNVISTNTAGNCMIFISNSDASSSCASSPEEHFYAESQQALPIGIFNFNGTNANKYNVLNWKTNYEENNQVQLIQRSKTGVDDWENISDKPSIIENGDIKSYEVVDKNPFAKTYYRIYSRDFDGFEQYSSMIVLSMSDISSPVDILSLYPNPAYDFTIIELMSESDEDVDMSLLDINGRLISAATYRMEEGHNLLSIDLVGLNAGQYYILLSNDRFNQTFSVVRQ